MCLLYVEYDVIKITKLNNMPKKPSNFSRKITKKTYIHVNAFINVL